MPSGRVGGGINIKRHGCGWRAAASASSRARSPVLSDLNLEEEWAGDVGGLIYFIYSFIYLLFDKLDLEEEKK